MTFYEWDAPWYAASRDHPRPSYVSLELWSDWAAVRAEAVAEAREADATIVGSYVSGGPRVIDDLAAAGVDPLFFYDIDTPVTVAALRAGGAEYLRTDQVPLFTRYLSFTGGPFLRDVVEGELGAREAVPLYCSVDGDRYHPTAPDPELACELAYMGTYAADRQPVVERFLLDVADRMPGNRFIVAGPQYPGELLWPGNVRHVNHLPPERHPAFYGSAAWQLNATRADMVAAGCRPACASSSAALRAAMISDRWDGLDHFFTLAPRSSSRSTEGSSTSFAAPTRRPPRHRPRRARADPRRAHGRAPRGRAGGVRDGVGGA